MGGGGRVVVHRCTLGARGEFIKLPEFHGRFPGALLRVAKPPSPAKAVAICH